MSTKTKHYFHSLIDIVLNYDCYNNEKKPDEISARKCNLLANKIGNTVFILTWKRRFLGQLQVQ